MARRSPSGAKSSAADPDLVANLLLWQRHAQWNAHPEGAGLDADGVYYCEAFTISGNAVICMDVRIRPFVLLLALASVALGVRTYATEKKSQVPEPAAAVGFNTRTFGPDITIGRNWHKFTFFGVSSSHINAVQNPDGSVTINPGGNDYGAMLCTTARGPGTSFTGVAFGGGGYFQATMKFNGPASFWANDIENMNGVSAGIGPHHWPGQAYGFGNWIEVDFAEFDSPNVYGFAIHNWFGKVGSGAKTSTLDSGSPVSPPGADYTKPNTYGFLWVPATSSRQGYAKFFFNGVQVGNTITWSQYNPSAAPPPSARNGTAYSVLDKLHLALILGTGNSSPNTVYGVEVWQASAADNILRLPSRTPNPELTPPRQ
jgi:hypothetical protein